MQKLFCDSGHSGFCIFLICSVINHFHYFLNTKIILCFCAQWRKSIHLPSFPTVLLRRILFLRKHHPMDLSSFSGWLSALFPLHLLYWLYCDVRIQICAALSGAFSGSTEHYMNCDSFRNLPLIPFIYYLIDAMIRKRTLPSCFPSCIFPVSEFRICRVFIRPVNPLPDSVIFQNIRCCDSSLLIVYSIAEHIQL